MGFDQYLDYDPTAPVKEDILVHGTREAIKRSRARFLQKAANRIRSGYCQGYEECCRNIAISNGLQIPLERALLIHDDLVSSSPFDFEIQLTFFRNLIILFASILYNTLCSMGLIPCGNTTPARALSSLRKIKTTCYSLSRETCFGELQAVLASS